MVPGEMPDQMCGLVHGGCHRRVLALVAIDHGLHVDFVHIRTSGSVHYNNRGTVDNCRPADRGGVHRR